MTEFVVGLGSNLGDRLGMMKTAVARMSEHIVIVRVSPVYETAPVGGPSQPAYLNAAVLIETPQAPEPLLDVLLSIELSLGRMRHERWGPRTIDLDILWTRGPRFESARLTVPHARLAERRFALLPLLDVAPDAIDPSTGIQYALPDGAVRQYELTL